MNLGFMSVTASEAIAHSPMARAAAAAGARFEDRDGWRVAIAYGVDGAAEQRAAQTSAGWADVSSLAKFELQGPSGELDALAGTALPFGSAVRSEGAWWCRVTPERALVIGGGGDLRERLGGVAPPVSVIDVTATFAAMTVVGPSATEVFARFSALDLRPRVTPVGALRPGSIARQPAVLVHESPQRYLFWFGAATAQYVWSVVQDAAEHLGGRPIGADVLHALPGPDERDPAARSDDDA